MLGVVNGSAPHSPSSRAIVPQDGAISQAGAAVIVGSGSRVRGPGEAGWWLRGGAAVLGLLAGAAAAVSWQAQYVMVLSVSIGKLKRVNDRSTRV